MKKIAAAFTIFIIITAAFFALTAQPTAAMADSDTFYVASPILNNYLYLDSPVLTAVNGDTVAVYDSGLDTVFLSGGESARYPTDFLADGERLVQLTFAGNKLYALTDRARLYSMADSGYIDFEEDILNMAADENGNLYYYYGTNSLYRADGTRYKDAGRLIVGSTDFAVYGGYAYFLKDNSVYKLPLGADSSAASIYSTENAASVLTAGGNVYIITSVDIIKTDIDGNAISVTPLITAFPDIDNLQNAESDGTYFSFINSGEKAVYTYLAADYSLCGFYGCSGSGDGWYNSPSRIDYVSDNLTAVWDNNNSRVQLYDTSDGSSYYVSYNSSYNFDLFAADGTDAVFVKNGVLYFTSLSDPTENADFTTVDTSYDISALSYLNGKVYIKDAANNALITYDTQTGKYELFCYLPYAVTDITARGGDTPIVYALTDSGVFAYTKSGKEIQSIEREHIKAFDVDYIGNIYVAYSDGGSYKITAFTREAEGFDEGITYTLSNAAFALEDLSSFAMYTEGGVKSLYAVDSVKNVLIRFDVDYIGKNDYTAPLPVDISTASAENISFVKSKGAAIFKYYDNFNILSDTSSSGELLMAFSEFSDDDYLYVMTERGNTGYILNSRAAVAAPSEKNGTVISLFDTVNIYNQPYVTANHLTFDKQQVFTLVNDCAGFDSGNYWCKVSYEAGGTVHYGYLLKTRVMSYNAKEAPKEDTYAKVVSPGVGVKVKMYAMADETSSVVKELSDGNKVKLLEKFDKNSQYTYCESDGVSGYVPTSMLQLKNGLTNGQIAAIVLASATVVITALYLIISRRNKKLRHKQSARA